jgi:ATP-dependent Clp protease ATP-binding subunit ClpC
MSGFFDRYTEQARRVLFFAKWEASFWSPYVGTEHILLALLREDESIRNQLQGLITKNQPTVPVPDNPGMHDVPLSQECMRVLRYASFEADRLSHKHIGTEHLFLGLLRENGCVASSILEAEGIDLASARKRILERQAALDVSQPERPITAANDSSIASVRRVLVMARAERLRQTIVDLERSFNIRLDGFEDALGLEREAEQNLNRGSAFTVAIDWQTVWAKTAVEDTPSMLLLPNRGLV